MGTMDRRTHDCSEVAPELFPWTRHLTAEDMQAFTLELAQALHDPAPP
ncbi:hypothetical protein ABZW49_12385 [Nonomuraea wenchangensis]